jgi:hypothetical protein
MISTKTFKELLKKEKDIDFVLNVIRADYIIANTFPFGNDFTGRYYLNRLIEENEDNGLTEEHFLFSMELEYYESKKLLERIGGSISIFPKRKES